LQQLLPQHSRDVGLTLAFEHADHPSQRTMGQLHGDQRTILCPRDVLEPRHTFASGFLVRPIGGVLLGRYADRVGRTRALSFVMLMMCAGTLLLGLAPGYTTLGVAAPLLVLLARLVQGLAIGAQFSLSVIIVETAPPGQKMFYGSFNMSSQALAVLLSSGCGYLLTTYLAPASILNWG
jgi:MHS family proline/betaine transporter-like MFS transporter